jgi:hypothetical protein
LTKQARQSTPKERQSFIDRLKPFYLAPKQLVFVHETSKDGRSAYRKHAWSSRGTKAIVSIDNSRGKRVSAVAAVDSKGFTRWSFTMDTFTRFKFLEAFNRDFLNILNPWPIPNSIVIIDNAKIHMCKEFLDAIHSRGALIFFLPPYCPEYNITSFLSLQDIESW